MKKPFRQRILASVLTLAMVFGMMPVNAFATEASGKPSDTELITSIGLADEVKIQTMTVGSEDTPNLPNKLNAEVTTTWEEVVTSVEDEEKTVSYTSKTETETVEVDVNWVADNEFLNTEEATFVYTSELVNNPYELASEVEMPIITVNVVVAQVPSDEKTITSFVLSDDIKTQTINVDEDKAPTLPEIINATLKTDETVAVDVNWTTGEEFSNAEAKTFVYTSELNDTAYTVASEVEMPIITVNVVVAQAPSDEKTITSFVLSDDIKTQTINVDEDKAPTLPKMLNATLKTDETVAVDVNWTAGEEFSNAEAKTFVYTSELNDTAYTVASEVEMPIITVNVVADAPADNGLTPNLMSLDNGLVDNGEGMGYLTDSYGLMAYKYTGKNFDIHGKFNGDWKQVTYSDSGFSTQLKIGSTESDVNAVSSANGGYTVVSTGLNIVIDLIIQNEGQIIEIKYTVKNNNANDVTFSLGSGEDIQIGNDDSAPITSFGGDTGFMMVSTNTLDKNAAGEYAQFNAFLKDAPGVDDVSGYWYGYWSDYEENVFTDLSPKDPLTGTDSGATWHWENKEIAAGATQTYSIKLGIGGKGSENAVRSGVDYAKEQLSELEPNAVYKITVDGTEHELTADANGQIPLVSDTHDFIGKTISIVKKGTDGAADSEASEVEIGARPPAPELEQTGGLIQDATTDLEYSLDGGNTWSSIDEDGALDEIYEQSETVLLRVKATNEAPAGPAQNFAFFADSLPQWAKDAGLDESNAMWNEAEQKLVLKDNVTLTDTLEVPDGSNVTIKVHEGETLTAPTGKPAITTNSDLTIGGTGTIKGSDGAESGSPAISVTGGNVTIDEDSTIEGGDATTGNGGSAIEVTGNTATVTNNGTITGGTSDSGVGGSGITSDEDITVAGSGSVTGGDSTSGAGGDGITAGGNVTVNGGGSVTGGGSTSGTGGNGITVPKDKDVAIEDDSKINGGTGSGDNVSGGIVIEGDAYTIDYVNEKITIKVGYTAKIKGSADDFSNTVDFAPNTTYIVKKGDVEIEFTTAARSTNPTLTQKQETVQSKKDGTIVGVTDKMEYSTDGGTTWNDVSDFPLTGFSNETVSIRIKATHDTPCSETVKFAFTESETTLKVIFNANGGSATSTQENIAYNSEITVIAPTRGGHTFDGWYIDKAFTKFWGQVEGNVLDNYTLQAKWTADATPKYEVSGTVTDESGSGVKNATVEIYSGKQLIATTTTNDNGEYTFSEVLASEYNIVIISGDKVKTILATVGASNATVPTVELSTKAVSSKVEVKAGTPEVLVGGLDKVAENENPTAGEKIEVKLEAESKTDETAPADEVIAIKSIAHANVEFIDMTVTKTTSSGGNSAVETVTNTGAVLEIIIPYDISGKQNITVYRYHNGSASAFTKLTARPTSNFADATYFVGADYIAVYTNNFSTYAIGYTTNTGGGSSGSRGNEVDREYEFWAEVKESIAESEDGDTIKVDAKNYDRMPWTAMDLLHDYDVNLVIDWNGGETILIPSGEAQDKVQGRIYWPLSMLEELYSEAELSEEVEEEQINPQTGGILPGGSYSNVISAPLQTALQSQTEEEAVVTEEIAVTITPPTAGFEADAFADTEDAITAIAEQNNNTAYIVILMLAVISVIAVYVIYRKIIIDAK